MIRFFLVACAVSFIGKAVGITHESTKQLKDTLLQDYDSHLPPIPSDGKPVSVKLGVAVISFRRVDFHWVGHPPGFKSTSYPPGLSARWMQVDVIHLAREERVRMTRRISIGWDIHLVSNPPPIHLVWNDERLMWEPSDHSNISTLRMPSNKVWIPDITPHNEATEDEFDSSLHQQLSSHTLVYSNGEVLFVPNVVLKTYCQGDLTHWPLDRQVCSIKFGSWVYDGNLVNLSLYGSPEDTMDMQDYRESTHWTVVGMPTVTREEIFYSCCSEPYIDLLANVTFSRKPSVFYHTALFFPVIVTFMRIMMCLQVIGLIWSLLTLLIASTHNGVTSKLAQLSQTALGKVFCLFTEIPEELLEGEGKGTSARTEILVMNFLDRICFYVFLFTIAINFAVNWPHREAVGITHESTKHLKDTLLQDYDSLVPPIPSDGKSVFLEFRPVVISYRRDDLKGEAIWHLWMDSKWNDERLTWEPSNHSNISDLRMPPDNVWIPDISIYNEESEDEFDSSLHQQVSSHTVVKSNGEVHFVPNLVFRTYCEGDLTHWPFDQHMCDIKFGSWVYDGNRVNLSLDGSPEDALDLSAYRTALLTLAAQWYPAGSTHRVMYFFFNFFVLLVLQFYHSAFIPMTGASDIKILTFMRIMMCLQVIGLIWSLLTLLIASTHNGVTSKLAQLSQTALGKVFCLFTEMPKELTEGEGNGTSAWTEILVSNFLDRLCFYAFLCTIAFNFALNWPHRQGM
ncbi:unnamed protein product [Darwinula stevensoni]|uniref:Neurotransmitter-gated ion-channel ligand-binding domain-containing protein n=1 Tax=Darwinula stevensoni TaxID=69355 RepID=A0A7R8X9L5_9CRUS|nr:unnamed protein product [Darwinula stevensoni]CAG0884634.1 unnamed protein product [Darwinula stevensoni]